MTDDQRAAVLANAKYLRQVRPIDPEEIYEYVEGEPHPAVVRQILREEASELGLVERDDGTFVPVEEGPIDGAVGVVDALLERHARRLEDMLVEELGPGWPEGETGDRLRERIREIKERYLHGSPVEYDELTALGYAVYHLPQSYAAASYVLGDLAADGLLPRRLRVLDVGAGVGGPALALFDLVPDDALVDYHAVEPSAAADVLDGFLAKSGRNVHSTVHREAVEEVDPGSIGGPFDLVLCANVLSELDDPDAVVAGLLDELAADGSLVALAPADRNTAIGLREVERAAETDAGATIYAPTVRLWPGERPTSECWSFDRKPDLETPAVQAKLDDAGAGDGEFVNSDVQFASSVLRTDGRTRVAFHPDPDRVAKMAAMDDHVTRRIDCVGIKLSPDLAATGGRREGSHNPLFLVGDGSERVDHFAVRTEASTLNDDLEGADYGAVLFFENVLILWNDDEAAYNLVVDGETVVGEVSS